MAITNVSAARRAGFKITNRGIKKAAAIAMSKMGTRQLYIGIPSKCFYLTGAGVVAAADGVFVSVTFPDAVTSDAYVSIGLPAEWISTSDVLCHIYWKSTAVTGNAKFTVEIASKTNAESTALSDTQTITTAADSTANKITKSSVTFAASFFAAGDVLGLHIQRNPADAADTLGADLKVVHVVLEFTGRG